MSWTLNDIYHIWKRQVRAMGREMAPSAVRCLCMIARSSTAPPDHAWVQLAEVLQVKQASKWPWIQLSSNEEVVDSVPCSRQSPESPSEHFPVICSVLSV